MSDPDLLSELPPSTPAAWRDRLQTWAETLDLPIWRLLLGVVVLAVAGLGAWRLLAPSPPPPEMTLPFVSTTVAPAASHTGDAHHSAVPAGASDGNQTRAVGTESSEVVVHVAGAVHHPGVQRLGVGARIVDAVDAAGGATEDADLARVNLAAPVEDGQQVYLPRIGEEPPVPIVGAGPGPGGAANADQSGGLVPVNTASAEELEQLPGVGPVIAEAIVAHREQHGPFSSIDDLVNVRGIGDAKLEGLRDHATV
jgi:competence protein ComEA